MHANKRRVGLTVIEYGMIGVATAIAAVCIYFGLSH
jgi:hypothetical protein